jgi:hypothetical protein
VLGFCPRLEKTDSECVNEMREVEGDNLQEFKMSIFGNIVSAIFGHGAAAFANGAPPREPHLTVLKAALNHAWKSSHAPSCDQLRVARGASGF